MDRTKFPRPIFQKPLRDITGDTSAAIFLGQLIFLTNTTPPERLSYGRIRKTADEWNDFFGFERSELERVNSICKDKKLVDIKRMGVPATNHYRIDKKEISRRLSDCGIPANWIAEILHTGLRESSKQDSPHSANINSNKDIEYDLKTKAEEKTPATAATIFDFFENNDFGKATGHNKSELQKLANNHSEEWIMYAMAQGVEHNKKNLAYIKSILKRIKQEGQIIGAKNVNGTNKSGITQPKGYGQFTRLENVSPESKPTSQATINAAQRIVAAKRAKAEGKSNV